MIEKHKKDWFDVIVELRRYKDIHIESYPTYLSIEERIKHVRNDIHNDYKDTGNRYLDRQQAILENELGTPTTNELVVGVRLKNSISDVQDVAQNAMSAVGDVARRIISMLGYDSNKQYEVFEAVRDESVEVLSILNSLNARKLTQDEMIYINRFAFLRDIDNSLKIDKVNETNLNNSIIDPSDPGYLILNSIDSKVI